jgi:hypothetical protein
MSLQEFSDWLGIIGWFITGVWILRDHLRKRNDFPRINLHASLREIARSGNDRVVEVVAEIENSGNVRHVFRSITYSIRGSRLKDLMNDPTILGQVHLPIVVTRSRRFFPRSWEYSFVDAGQKSTYRHLITIPRWVRLAQLHVIMSYDDAESDFHSAMWNGTFPD